MESIVVVNNPSDWSFDLSGVQVVPAWDYLTKTEFSKRKGTRIFNLCRSYRYQSIGYYVSLLAAARGHKPLPTVNTIQDLKSPAVVRVASWELEDLIGKALKPLQSDSFRLSIYFGRNVTKRYDKLASSLFRLFGSPLLRARFRREDGEWSLSHITAIAASEIPQEHMDFVREAAVEFFKNRHQSSPRRSSNRFDMAVLWDENEPTPPSNRRAVERFLKASHSLGFSTELITKDDMGRLAEFDALFIRSTTSVNHHTFRMARRAEAEGLVVIDDPTSILKCTNKVFLAEALELHGISTPRTLTISRGDLKHPPEGMSFPIILKQPDSSFSQGVHKVEDLGGYRESLEGLLETSALVIAQEYIPTDFDWRVGVLDGKPLFVCKYFMAGKHWQILKKDGPDGKLESGRAESVPVESAPGAVVKLALRAARLIGDGLYGVDIKQAGKKLYLIEVNDNPNIDAGVEDAELGEDLYRRIAGWFLRRIENRKGVGF